MRGTGRRAIQNLTGRHTSHDSSVVLNMIDGAKTELTPQLQIPEIRAAHGFVEEFSGKGSSSWAISVLLPRQRYIEDRFKKRAVLLTLFEPSIFETVKALVAPRTPSDNSFEDIVSLVRAHYDTRSSEL